MDIIEPEVNTRKLFEIHILEDGEVNTRKLFEIHILEDGEYAAIREHEPLFCFTGSTISEVSDIAIRAFESFKKLNGN